MSATYEVYILPFLKKKNASVGVITQDLTHQIHQKDEENHGLIAAARDLIDAIHNNDEKAAAAAMQAAFELMELQPHEEAEHE